jgi:hypothetical protein
LGVLREDARKPADLALVIDHTIVKQTVPSGLGGLIRRLDGPGQDLHKFGGSTTTAGGTPNEPFTRVPAMWAS